MSWRNKIGAFVELHWSFGIESTYLFVENFFVDDSGTTDATLPVLAKVSPLIEVSQVGVPYEQVHELRAQFT